MKQKIIALFFLLSVLVSFSFAQKIKELGVQKIENYNNNFTINDIVIGPNNLFYYVGIKDGAIHEFDGKYNRLIFKHDSIFFTNFFKKENQIFVGADNEFGILKINNRGEISYVSVYDFKQDSIKNEFSTVNIHEINDTIIFVSDNATYFLAPNKNFVEKYNLDFETKIVSSANIHNKLWIVNKKSELFCFENRNLNKIVDLKLVHLHKIVEFGGRITFLDRKSISYFNDNQIEQPICEINNILSTNNATTYYKINDDYIAIGVFEKGIYIIDKDYKIVRHFDIDTGFPDNIILSIFSDNQNNIWSSTASSLSRIELFSPFTYLNKFSGVDNGLMIWSEMINDSTIIFSLTTGLYSIINNKIEKITGGDGFFFSYIIFKDKVFVSNYFGVYVIEDNMLEKIQDTKLSSLILTNQNAFVAAPFDGVFEIKIDNNKYSSKRVFDYSPEIDLLRYQVDTFNYLWQFEKGVCCRYNFNIQDETFLKKDTIDSLNWGREISKIDNRILIYNDSKQMIFNNQLFKFEEYKVEKNPKRIYQGKDGGFMLVYDNEIMYRYKDITRSKQFNSLPFKNLSGAYFPLTKNDIIIGFTNEFVHYDSEMKDNSDLFYRTIFRKISISNNIIDSTFFTGNYILCKFDKPQEFKYEFNNITFNYSGIFYEKQDSIIYSTKLEGIQSNWSAWSSLNIKEYTNLPEGNYTFKVKAKNIYDTESSISEFSFIILPPWYRTWWAYFLFGISTIILLYIIIKLNTRRLVAAKKKLEQIVKERTVEIEQQKEEIETQRDMLVDVNIELEKLSIVASETYNAVTIADGQGIIEWTNEGFTRLFGYTKDEFVSIKGINMVTASSFDSFSEKFIECVENKTSVLYESKVKTKSGEEIWTQTTLTPIFNEFGEIKKIIAIDSNISDIKKAQEEIALKNKQITDSINYAQFIQKAILPSDQIVKANLLKSFIFFKPKDIVSGDFYWFSQQGDISYIVAADATGHGVPGAFMSMIGTTLLNDIVNKEKIDTPSEILLRLNRGVVDILSQGIDENEDISDGMDLSICKIDKNNNKITLSLANHYAYIVKDNNLEIIDGDIFSIGGFWAKNPNVEFTNIELKYSEVNALYMFSDGFRDQPNENKEKLKDSRFKEIIEKISKLEINLQYNQLDEEFNNWKGKAEQIDDILVIGIKL